jgi:hypothetical protein
MSTAAVVLALTMLNEFPDLDALRRNRVLSTFAPRLNDSRWIQQTTELDGHKQEIAKRDRKLFVISETSTRALELRQRLEVAENDSFAVVLVGKDGYRKLRKTRPVEAEELFRLIDSMPMRKAEMRGRH